MEDNPDFDRREYETTSDKVRKLYSEVFGYLREARSFLVIAVVLFLLGIWLGLTYPSVGEELLSGLKTMARQMRGKSTFSVVVAIFIKNSLASAIAIFLGPLLGIVPVISAIGNGIMVGTVMSHVEGTRKILAVLQLIPHGLFELPAIFIAWGVGLWQGAWLFHKSGDTFRERRHKALRIFLRIIIPLLVIAAVIEGTSIYIMTK